MTAREFAVLVVERRSVDGACRAAKADAGHGFDDLLAVYEWLVVHVADVVGVLQPCVEAADRVAAATVELLLDRVVAKDTQAATSLSAALDARARIGSGRLSAAQQALGEMLRDVVGAGEAASPGEERPGGAAFELVEDGSESGSEGVGETGANGAGKPGANGSANGEETAK